MIPDDKQQEIIELVKDGMYMDGGHHKQWYLEEVLKLCGVDVEKLYEEASEDEEDGGWDRGIPP